MYNKFLKQEGHCVGKMSDGNKYIQNHLPELIRHGKYEFFAAM